MRLQQVIHELESLGKAENLEGMKKFGISPRKGWGVPMPALRALAKKLGRDHDLALELWASEVHDARILACLIDDPKKVTESQMQSWAKDFYSWDLCDQCCMNLFDKTTYAYKKVNDWSRREEEFVRRAAFSLAASLAVHDKKASDEKLASLLPLIEEASTDERNMVKKAVSWALRQIGKRNIALNAQAIQAAERIKKINSRSARWIASDALRELRSEEVRSRLERRAADQHSPG
jgi:3-methyladenine DNA glycosylase AlkD